MVLDRRRSNWGGGARGGSPPDELCEPHHGVERLMAGGLPPRAELGTCKPDRAAHQPPPLAAVGLALVHGPPDLPVIRDDG